MRILRSVSMAALFLSVFLWTAGRTVLPLPDWAVRANGIVMMISMALLVFAGVWLKLRDS